MRGAVRGDRGEWGVRAGEKNDRDVEKLVQWDEGGTIEVLYGILLRLTWFSGSTRNARPLRRAKCFLVIDSRKAAFLLINCTPLLPASLSAGLH